MENTKKVSIRFSTVVLLIIILLLFVGIVYLIIQNNNLQITKNNSQTKVNQLQNNIEQLEQTINEVKNITSNEATKSVTNDNIIANNTSINSTVEKKSTSSIEIGYEELIIIIDGKPYIMPIYRPDSSNMEADLESKSSYYYNKFEVENIKSNVKSAYAFSLGLDPSSTIYFVMEDGSVKVIENSGTIPNIKYISKEVLPASKNIVELKMESGTLNAITKDGIKIKIAESQG